MLAQRAALRTAASSFMITVVLIVLLHVVLRYGGASTALGSGDRQVHIGSA